MILRQPRPGQPGNDTFGTADLELIDWMNTQGLEPGQEFELP